MRTKWEVTNVRPQPLSRPHLLAGRAPSYETLARVLDSHIRHIPFENFDVLLGHPIQLAASALQTKMVEGRRGGYCFEHATLMAAALEALGFAVRRHIARVVLFQSYHEAPRDHMYLTVSVDGERLVIDPGFGPFAPPFPIPMDGTATPDGHRMTHDGALWMLHGRRRHEDFTGWASTMADDNPVDFEMSNHFKSTHPGLLFRQQIFASAVTPAGRVNVMNRDVTWVSDDTETSSELTDRPGLRTLLAQHFGFDLPEAENIKVAAIPDWT
ncbi:arylamine N-acetyltransferase [Methylobacterium sp. NEAU K]|uniref:arylamine N-acetyltransferase family protein n=1 Tax=Methylobacterium sp. NEAU K TaxID=3064946 RepID=UPI002735630A|nr:arylamine N-acetyltransferase [Methylobacterium sp. NEAU K]MDP4006829.1 arylamine N-acetyltransferase [Methylobacterium sp. NEAU K]